MTEFDGEIRLIFDDERTRLPMSEPDVEGRRSVFTVCCDCGLVHEFEIGPDYVTAVRAPESEAEKIRAAVLSANPDYFPLRRPEKEEGGGARPRLVEPDPPGQRAAPSRADCSTGGVA
jgi:hypothetical protein